MRHIRLIVGLLALFGLTACMSPAQYETAPVEIVTRDGVVTCQLYTPERVIWDRSISRPPSLSVEDADQICVEEGTRRATMN